MNTKEFKKRVKILAQDDIIYWQNEIKYLKGSMNYLDLANIENYRETILQDLKVLECLDKVVLKRGKEDVR